MLFFCLFVVFFKLLISLFTEFVLFLFINSFDESRLHSNKLLGSAIYNHCQFYIILYHTQISTAVSSKDGELHSIKVGRLILYIKGSVIREGMGICSFGQ
jgi:hypothetical protein